MEFHGKIKYGNRFIKFKKTSPKNISMKGKVSFKPADVFMEAVK
jgi:hypothetical protein